MYVLAVTGARSDWGLLAPVLTQLQEDSEFTLKLAVTGQHLKANSNTLKTIEDEGFIIDYRVDMKLKDDSRRDVTRAMARVLAGFGDLLAQNRPDMMLVLGDRYEIVAAVTAALLAKVPVAHLCGGDVTEGAFDDAIRHSITKMAHLHFVTNSDAAQRVLQMGEDPERVHTVGSPGLDRIHQIKPLCKSTFFAEIGLKPKVRNLLITFHPVTLSNNSTTQCQVMLDALGVLDDAGLIFTGSNADPEGLRIQEMVRDFVSSHANSVFHESLSSKLYFSAMHHVDAIVGNSSSGLYEAPSFGIPTVNIGDRQSGRLRAKSVIDCPPNSLAIRQAIERAFAMDCTGVPNPFGDGRTARRIVDILKKAPGQSVLIRKKFRNISV